MSERLKDFDQAIDIMVHNYQWMIDSEKRSKTELHAKNYADYREFIVEAYKKALERVEELEKKLSVNTNNMKQLQKQNERYKQALQEIDNEAETAIHYGFTSLKDFCYRLRKQIEKAMEEEK